jgi:hypothetical protein
MSTHFALPFTKGLDRAVTPSRADQGSFYTMTNFRHKRNSFGELETTPSFYLWSTIAQGTYWTGSASATEPTSSSVKFYQESGLLNTVVITSYCVSITAGVGQLKSILRTTQPAATGVTKGCMLVVNNVATISVTLGNTYDVEIDGATTFKWRVNGGAYTTLVAISMAGNSIDGGAATLYWLASSGFTIADAWVFTRTDTSYKTTNIGRGNVRHSLIDNRLFYTADSGALLSVQRDSAGSFGAYVRSAGYRNVAGYNVSSDSNHLFVYQNSITGTFITNVVQTSDLTDLDAFVATDVNEADSYTQNYVTTRPVGSSGLEVFSGHTLFGSHFIFTSYGIYRGDYAGLPAPYSFKFYLPCSLDSLGSAISSGNISTVGDKGIYFYSKRRLLLFDGAIRPLVDFSNFDASNVSPVYITYNQYYNEVIIVFSTLILVYNENNNTTHLREVAFNTSGFGPGSIHFGSDGRYYFGNTERRVFREDLSYAETPVFDKTSGTAFATPTLCTQMLGQQAATVKDTDDVYLAASSQTGSSSTYSVAAFIQVALKWYNNAAGLISGSPSSHASSIWTSAAQSGQISYPRTDARFIAYQFEVTGTDGTKPPGALSITHIEPDIRLTNNRR